MIDQPKEPSANSGSQAFDGHVLIAHDWLVTWGGAERVLDELAAMFPEADIVTAIRANPMARDRPTARRARELWVGRLPGARDHHEWFLPLEGLGFAQLDTADYDIVISSSHAFAKAVKPGRSGVHLCYCYSPARYAWDQYETYALRSNFPRRMLLRLTRRGLQFADRSLARRVSHFIAVSQFVARRIELYYGRGAKVVYPPVSPKGPHLEGEGRRESFLLYLGRLVPYKRIDLLIEAANQLGLRLIIAGVGHDRPRLERLAGPRIEFLGAVSEERAAELLQTCACFVFAAEEDFGIAPVEANAHGTPVVAYSGGGARETMIAGVTAELFDEPTVASAANAIRRAMGRSWDDVALVRNADRFSPQRFRARFSATLNAAMRGEQW